MSIGEKTRAPMMCGSQRNFQRTEADRLPFIKLVHDIESEPMNQTSDTDRNNDWLIGRNRAQRAPIEMIEMRVRHENEIDRRQMMNMKSRLLESFDHAQPHRPDRIDQHVRFVGLDQERGMPDPGDANLAGLHFWKKRTRVSRAGALGEERRNPDAGDEMALGPVAA